MNEPDPLVEYALDYLATYDPSDVERGNKAHDALKAACTGRETVNRKAALVLAAEVLRLRGNKSTL